MGTEMMGLTRNATKAERTALPASHAGGHGWRWGLALALILATALLTRVVALNADPPDWLQGAFISDEGWWADGARGKIFFNDYYSDDFGTAYLMTPGYTWALEWIYRLWGVGTAQTRALAAGATLLTIACVGMLLWRAAGRREALLGALLLVCSPFFWVYGRVGLQEPAQALLVAVSFTLWVMPRHRRLAALGAGVAIGMAMAVKPNALTLGLLPVAVGAAGGLIGEHTALGRPLERRRLRREALLRAALAALGLGLVLLALTLGHALPNWERFAPMARVESGAEEAGWKQRLTLPGMLLVSTQYVGTVNTPVTWNPARWSPALMTGFWFCALSLLLRWRTAGMRGLRLTPLEAAALGWALATLAVIGSAFYQPDRRALMLMAPLATVVALFLGRVLRDFKSVRPRQPLRRGGWWSSLPLWLVLTLPVLVALKPALTRGMMRLTAGVPLGRDAGLDYAACGTLVMIGWMALLAALATGGRAERLSLALLRRRLILVSLGALLLVEAGVIGWSLASRSATLAHEQGVLRGILREGETVMGHVATTVLLPLKVRTVRRVSVFETAPPPNPDVWERLRPRYILEMTGRNYGPATPLYPDLVARGGYRMIYRFGLGPPRGGVPRYSLELYERGGGGADGDVRAPVAAWITAGRTGRS